MLENNIHNEPSENTEIDVESISRLILNSDISDDFQFNPEFNSDSDSYEENEETAEFTDNEDSEIKKPKNSLIQSAAAYVKSAPKDVTLLAGRILLSAILLAFANMKFMPETLSLVLSLLAVIVCIPWIACRAAKDLLYHNFYSKPAVVLIIAVIYAALGKFINGCAAAVVFDIGTIAFKKLSDNKLSVILNDEENRADDYAPNKARISDVITKIRERRFDDAKIIENITNLLFVGILGIAALISFFPPIFDKMLFGKWISRGLAIASVASVSEICTVAVFYFLNGVLKANSEGIILTSPDNFNTAYSTTSVLFNKTGTITEGALKVINIEPVRISQDELLFLASYAEAYSDHPIAKAIRNFKDIKVDTGRILNHHEEAGMGCTVQLSSSHIVSIGNLEFLEKLGVRGDIYSSGATCAYVAVGTTYVGRIEFEDNIKESAEKSIRELKKLDVANIALMTGDNALSATLTGRKLGISEIYSDYQLNDKVERIKYILDTQEHNEKLMYVGDGINDGELLELADAGIVLGTASMPDVPADIFIDSNDLHKVPEIISISKQVWKRLKLSGIITVAIKLVLIILSAIGIVPAWLSIIVLFAAAFFELYNPFYKIK